MPFACGFSMSFWKSSPAIVMVQSAGPEPGLHDGPDDETSMFHSPSPVTFIWYFAPMDFASSVFFASAAGRSSLKSFLISAGIAASLEPVNGGSVGYHPAAARV